MTEEERKEANREYQRRWRKNNKEKMEEYWRLWKEKNAEKVKKCEREKCKRWREKNKEKIAAYNKKYKQEHKEELAEQSKKYIQEHKAEKAEYNRKYRQEHKEEIKEYDRKWKRTPLGRAHHLISAYKIADRKAKRGECTLTTEWVIENIFSQPCHYCGETDWTKIGCDRIDNSKPHTEDNVVPCCEQCNIKRKTMDYEEFKKKMG